MSSLLVGIMMAKKNARKSVHRMKKSKRMEKMCKIEKALEDSECSRKVERQIETALEDLEYHEDIVDPMEDGYTCTYDEFEEAVKLLYKVVNKKIETEGEWFIKPDGGPKDIYDKLDLRELKEKHPNVEEESLILSLELYTDRAKGMDVIEKRFKLGNFFLKNAYENYPGGQRKKKLMEDEREMREIYPGLDYPISWELDFYTFACYMAAEENKSVEQALLDIKNERIMELEKQLERGFIKP